MSIIGRLKRATSKSYRELKKKDFEKGYYISEILAKCGLFFAAIFAVYQFYQSQEDNRIERAMVYVDRFEKGDIADARRAIREKTRPYYRQFIALNNVGVTVEDRKEITLLLVEEDVDGSLANALEETADFYQGLKLCTDVGLCQEDVVIRYFCPSRSLEVWENFSPFFLDRRKNNREFGAALEWCASKPQN